MYTHPKKASRYQKQSIMLKSKNFKPVGLYDITPFQQYHSYLVIFTIGFPMQAFGAIMFKNAAMVGAISVISTGSDV